MVALPPNFNTPKRKKGRETVVMLGVTLRMTAWSLELDILLVFC
jgi:hypothetical protein